MTFLPKQEELDCSCLLSSFASLLSFAKINEGESPLAGSSESLQCFLSPTVPDTELCCSFPSLRLHKQDKSSLYVQFSDKLLSLEEAAAFNLAAPMLCSRGSDQLINAPSTLLNNVSSSFMYLINSRMKNMIKALTKQDETLKASHSDPDDITTGTQDRISLILALLAESNNPVEFQTVVTNFRVITGEGNSSPEGELESVLPLIFEVVFEVKILGAILSNFSIQVPGTITGSFNLKKDTDGHQDNSDGLLTAVLVAFDTNILLSSMMKHARVIVKTAASAATAIVAVPSEIPNLTHFIADERKTKQSSFLSNRKRFAQRINQHHIQVESESSISSIDLNTHDSLESFYSNSDSSTGLSQDNSLSTPVEQFNSSYSSSLRSSQYPLGRGYFSSGQVKDLARIRKVKDARSSVLRNLKQSKENIPNTLPVSSRRVSFSFDINVASTGQAPVSSSQNASWSNKNNTEPLKKDFLKDASTAAIGLTLLQRSANKRDREQISQSATKLNQNKNESVDEDASRNDEYISPQLPLRKRRIKSCPGFSS